MLVPIAILVLALGGLAVGHRLIVPCRLPRRAAALGWTAVGLTTAAVAWFPLSWYLPIDLDRVGLWHLQHWVNFLAMGLLVYLVLAVAVRDGALVGRRLWLRLRGPRPAGAAPLALVRGLTLGVLVAATLVAAGGFGEARRRARVVRVEVPVAGLDPALDGFRIVQVSDLHAGHTVDRAYVEAVVEAVNGLSADLVALTGDLTDGVVPDLAETVAPLGRLRARRGVYLVTGNHEYYFGAAADWVEAFGRLGPTPLVNEHRVVEHRGAALVVAGVTDAGAGGFLAGHRMDLAAALEGAPAGLPVLLLAHQPLVAGQAAAAGVALQLSGHTHGGQLVPFHALVRLRQPFISGLRRVGGTWVYVSRGTGYWGPPFRTFAPSEITELVLVRG